MAKHTLTLTYDHTRYIPWWGHTLTDPWSKVSDLGSSWLEQWPSLMVRLCPMFIWPHAQCHLEWGKDHDTLNRSDSAVWRDGPRWEGKTTQAMHLFPKLRRDISGGYIKVAAVDQCPINPHLLHSPHLPLRPSQAGPGPGLCKWDRAMVGPSSQRWG